MGVISGDQNMFKSAELLYSKIKREWQSFGSVNLLNDADFPLYTSEVLRELGNGVMREEEVIIKIKNGKGRLPKDFHQIYAAYKCQLDSCKTTAYDSLQNSTTYYNEVTCDLLCRKTMCDTDCHCNKDKLLERVTVKQYVKEGVLNYNYVRPTLLRISPNVKAKCSDDCLNMMSTSDSEITINNGYIFTNFNDGDVYLKYYAFPVDTNGLPEIPNIVQVEKAIEWYIKWKILLNFWFTDELSNAQSKWQKAEEQYLKYMAEARFNDKLPTFAKLVDTLRHTRAINKVAAFSHMDNKRF